MNNLNNIKPIVFLMVETTARELDEKILLANYLANFDFKVVIGPVRTCIRLIKILKEGVLVGKSSWISKKRLFFSNNENLLRFHYDPEGLVFYGENSFLMRSKQLENLSKNEYVFLYGVIQKRILLSKYPNILNQIYVTGSPRFDLLNVKYNRLHSINSKYISRIYRKFILICTNFSHSNPGKWYKFSSPFEKFSKILDDSDESKHTLKLFKKMMQVQKKLQSDYIDLINLFSREYKDYDIIIRPHPSEDVNYYKNHFKNTDNVFVDKKYSISSWINHADLVIHPGSTTGIEAIYMNKPVIMYNPRVDSNDFKLYLAYNAGKYIDDLLECQSYVSSVLINKYSEKASSDFLNGYLFNNSSDKSSAEKMAEIIHLKYNENENPYISHYTAKLIGFLLFHLIIDFGKILRRVIKSFFWEKSPKFKSFKKVYITHFLSSIESQNDSTQKKLFKVRYLAKDTYSIEKNNYISSK